MERLTERTTDGILVKENHGENGLRTFYQLFEEKPNDKYTNCDGGYCAIEKLAAYEDAEEQPQRSGEVHSDLRLTATFIRKPKMR